MRKSFTPLERQSHQFRPNSDSLSKINIENINTINIINNNNLLSNSMSTNGDDSKFYQTRDNERYYIDCARKYVLRNDENESHNKWAKLFKENFKELYKAASNRKKFQVDNVQEIDDKRLWLPGHCSNAKKEHQNEPKIHLEFSQIKSTRSIEYSSSKITEIKQQQLQQQHQLSIFFCKQFFRETGCCV